jgi:hypothetical protein
MFEKDRLGKLDIDPIVSAGVFEQMFSPTCKKCMGEITISPFLFNSKEEIQPILEKQVLICPTCGSMLGTDNAMIMRYLRFSKLGLELAKGLWLEAYIYSLLAETRIPVESIAPCAVHEKDELDIVFSDGRNLYVCECKDKTVGQNDVYVLAMKANRISADKKIKASVDRVLMISTEPISKDIMPGEQTEETYGRRVEYIPISGELGSVREKLTGLINESKEKQKDRQIRQLLELIIGRAPLDEDISYHMYRDIIFEAK